MINQALSYLKKQKFSIIPLLPNKKPFGSLLPIDRETGKPTWKPYQTVRATEKEIRAWWTKEPKALIGIVTGKISGIAVVDIDSKEEKYIPPEFNNYESIPTTSTPRGFHFYFAYQDGITNATEIRKNTDIRGEGGYCVAPPSRLEDGKQYKWEFSIADGLPKFPMELLSQIEKRFEHPKNEDGTIGKLFIDGRRDEDLFHTANILIKGGMDEESAKVILRTLADNCNPPVDHRTAERKVQSALERVAKRERPLTTEAGEWVSATTGYFPVSTCYGELGVTSKQDKATIRYALKKLREAKAIEPHPHKHGWYRRIDRECEIIDWKNAPTKEIPLKFPLGIEEHVKIYPKSIIMIAGKSDAGKSAFLLDFAKKNMNEHEIHLFINEAGDTELAVRLGLFRGINKDDWKCTFWDREDNFADVIKPNAINLIDYLDVTEDFANIGRPLKEIHNKLDKGIAIIAIQKNPKQYDFKTGKHIDVDLGVGGAKSIGKSRLYLAIDDGVVKIVKAKNRRGKDSPNGMTRTFEIYDGHEFSDLGYWRKQDEMGK